MSRNVVLLVLDTVRRDYFDEFAPRIKERSDVQYTNCRAVSSCSVPSHGAILTEQLPSESGIHNFNVDYTAAEHTFLDKLPEHKTVGVSANAYVSTEFGFSDHFDEWINVSPYRRFPDGLDIQHFSTAGAGKDVEGMARYLTFLKEAVRSDHPAKSVSNGVFGLLDRYLSTLPVPKLLDDGANVVSRSIERQVSDVEEPFVCFANYMDAHAPMHHVWGYDSTLHDAPRSWSSADFPHLYQVSFDLNEAHDRHAKFLSQYRDLYAAAIDYLDRKVISLMKTIQRRTDLPTTFIVTSDHGENLGYEHEEYLFGHNSSLSEGLLHVPLEIANPPTGFSSIQQEPFSQLDLGALVSGIAKCETPDLCRSAVPAELIAGEVDFAKDLLSEEQYTYFKRAQRAIIYSEKKYVWDTCGNTILYRLGDRSNWQEHIEKGATIPNHSAFDIPLEEYRADVEPDSSFTERQNIDDATEDRLEELGYL
jgi:arylsulfatase A-like enzyme